MELIKSVVYSDTESIDSILKLHCEGALVFDCDPCYSKGMFWKDWDQEPFFKFDLNPVLQKVKQADCTKLPFANNELKSIVFDPPFMFGTHGQTKNNIMNKRFTMFDSFEELETMYKNSLKEFYRILIKGGILAFKCQDYTDSKSCFTHVLVYNWAIQTGFYAKDLFISVTERGRIYNPNLIQRHARKYHSYWWVFQK